MRSTLLTLLLVWMLPAVAAIHTPVFVLHSYSQEYPWTRGQHDGFMQALAGLDGHALSVSVEYLDTKRVAYTPAYAQLMAAHLAEKYQAYQPRFIYVTDDNALDFALKHLPRIFPDVPVFFSGVNNYQIREQLDPGWITGVFEHKEIAPNLELMRHFAPDIRDVLVVGDDSETYRAIRQELSTELLDYPDIHPHFISHGRIDALVADLRDRRERFVFLTTLGKIVNAQGETQTLTETLAAISNAGDFTILNMEDAYMAPGVLGGYVTSSARQGATAAALAIRHLQGVPLTAIAPQSSPNEYLINGTELEKAGLQLPADIATLARIIDPPSSFIEKYQTYLLGTLYILAALFSALLIGSLIVVMRKNRQILHSSSELQLQAEQLRASEAKLRTVIEGLPIILWVIDRNGIFLLSEGKGLENQNLKPGEVVGKSLFDMYRKYPEIVMDARRALEGKSFTATHWIDEHAFEVHYSPLKDAHGMTTHAIGVATDITERKRTEDRLSFLANYDPVTGLPNRSLFNDRLAHAIKHAERRGSQLALLFIDLDNFKQINDTLGHSAGDALLREVAERFKCTVRADDTVSRLGGDEFTIILENLATNDSAAEVAATLLRQSAQPYTILDHDLYVTPSIGVALYPQDGADLQSLVMNADTAMYRAKEKGRNNIQFFNSTFSAAIQERMTISNLLRGALPRKEFSLHYQPQIDIASGRVIGFEALLRWNNSERGFIGPNVFIPLLEDTGLIIPVGEWVLREACRWAARLDDLGSDAPPSIAVNISARQFHHANLLNSVTEALSSSGLTPDRLELEITESSLIDVESLVETMDQLKRIGVSLSIDDFGTGYSSLSYLKRFPVDRLKVDASFVRDVAIDPDDAAIVTAIIGLAHHLQLQVIAEGVETREQQEFLRAQGCDEIQGYLIARPMPAQTARDWLQAWSSDFSEDRPKAAKSSLHESG